MICLLLGGCQTAFFAHLNSGIEKTGYTLVTGVEFNHQPELKLDLYQPEQTLPGAPVVVFFYGGSWQSGKRSWYEFVGAALARRGILAIIPDYRTYSEVTFPDFMTDAALAVRWASEYAREYGGNPANLFLAGHSAGAHIAVLLGADDTYLHQTGHTNRELAGVIGLAGPYDFLPLKSDYLKNIFPGMVNEQSSQPVNFASRDDPPMLFLHGHDDERVWDSNSINMTKALQDSGSRAWLKIYPDIGHVDILSSLAENRQDNSPAFADMLEFIIDCSIPELAHR